MSAKLVDDVFNALQLKVWFISKHDLGIQRNWNNLIQKSYNLSWYWYVAKQFYPTSYTK